MSRLSPVGPSCATCDRSRRRSRCPRAGAVSHRVLGELGEAVEVERAVRQHAGVGRGVVLGRGGDHHVAERAHGGAGGGGHAGWCDGDGRGGRCLLRVAWGHHRVETTDHGQAHEETPPIASRRVSTDVTGTAAAGSTGDFRSQVPPPCRPSSPRGGDRRATEPLSRASVEPAAATVESLLRQGDPGPPIHSRGSAGAVPAFLHLHDGIGGFAWALEPGRRSATSTSVAAAKSRGVGSGRVA